jgi:hypothetical protein
MKRHSTGDVWTDANLLRAQERVAAARAFTARRALLGDARSPRRGVRVWLGSFLLAVGHRLLGPVQGATVPDQEQPHDRDRRHHRRDVAEPDPVTRS